ncbi:MAG: hypothetical protein ACIAS6_13455 [Phycisphaerales bacterium JB060]
MLWTVLWWTGGVAGSLVALWLLVAAAGLDRPRRWLRGGRGRSGALACGACGHEAVTPDTIATCPECGAGYAQVGLLTPKAGLRYGPPPWVVALLLLAGVVLGSAMLAPVAGTMANRRAIGAPQVEQARITSSFEPASGFALAVHQELARAQSMGTWSQTAPVLSGTVRVDLVAGATAGSGINHPNNQNLPKFFLELPTEAGSWRLLDATLAPMTAGNGLENGVVALFAAAGLGPRGATPAVTEAELAAIAQLVGAYQDARGGQPASLATLLPATGLTPTGQGMSVRGYHTFHRASPWGIAAGAATPAGLLLVAGLLLGAIGWSRRRMVAVGVRAG